ncbi:MAG: hypothetical protein ISS78_05450 [Phycisphaerae bacterium]|nr:hypothetical protein [Phycisphaerae bacterium]
MRIVVIASNRRFADPAEPHRYVADGLQRIGHDVEVVSTHLAWPVWKGDADLVVLWNGVKGICGTMARRARQAGAKVLVMERGFFDRMAHTQLDHQGFNHRASWAARLVRPAPPEGPERFRRLWGGEPTPVRPRESGYVLVLGQVTGDSQLDDSEIHHAGPLVRAVEDATPRDIDIRVRPHPLARPRPADSRAELIDGELADAVGGARFVVTINSNAANEALVWGCPVMALGPSLYGIAGVALQTHLADMAVAIRMMLDGWRPPREMTTNYLHHLACRQWSCNELAEGTVLQRLLADIP